MGFRFRGIHHISLVTGDMDTTVRYWRDLLGMRLVLGLGETGRRMYFFEVSDNNLIAFFEWPGVERLRRKVPGVPEGGRIALDHLSFQLGTMDELWALAERLIAGGFFVSNVMDHGFVKAFYSYDPNGLALEFCVEDEAYDVREKPRMLDREPTDTAREGFEPDPSRWPKPDEENDPDDRIILPGRGRKDYEW